MYKRLVVYLYHYENREKKENCGYMKIHINNGVCRMDIKISNASELTGKQGFYLLTEKNGRLEGHKVMSGEICNGSMEFRYECECSNVVDGCSVDEILGVLFYDGETMQHAICGTTGTEDMNLYEYTNNKEILTEEIRTLEDETTVYEYDEDCLKRKERGEKECGDTSEITECSMNLEDEVNCHTRTTAVWQEKLFCTFPKVRLHIGGTPTVGIKLKPQDIIWFPGKYWRLASNQFLLNGYGQYGYLMFFKGLGDQEGKYYLGTPGIFGIQSSMNAKKFGFTDFFAVEEGRNDKETFGFWCQET